MFFILSKVLGFFAAPSNFFISIGVLGLFSCHAIYAAGELADRHEPRSPCIAGLSPLGNALILPLEDRFRRGTRRAAHRTSRSFLLSPALLVGAGVAISDYVQNRRTAIRVAADTFKEKIGRINERRLAFFAAPFLIVEQLHDDPVLLQSTVSKDAILKWILSGLRMNPHISAVYAGYETETTSRSCRSPMPRNPSSTGWVRHRPPASRSRTFDPTMALAGNPGNSSTPAAARSACWLIRSPATIPAAVIGTATHARNRRRSSATTRMCLRRPPRSD